MGFNPIKKLKKVVKKAAKTVLDIPDKAKDSLKWAWDKAEEGSKGLGRAPGKLLKPPKIRMPGPEAVKEMPDEEEIKRLARRRLSGSGGSRANTVLTSGL